MGLVSPQQSNPGDTIEAADINTPVNQLAAVINGNIEAANLADSAVTTAKVADSSITGPKLDAATVRGQILGRNTLSVAGDTLTVSFTAKKYLYILVYAYPTAGTILPELRFNSDSGNNYSRQESNDFGAATDSVGQSAITLSTGASTEDHFVEGSITNVAAQQKLCNFFTVEMGATTATGAPDNRRTIGKWANTADQITSITVFNSGGGDFAIGSELIVLGHN